MILIGSMAIRVSNEDGSRKFATLARDWHPPNHVSCFLGGNKWKQDIMLSLYDIMIY